MANSNNHFLSNGDPNLNDHLYSNGDSNQNDNLHSNGYSNQGDNLHSNGYSNQNDHFHSNGDLDPFFDTFLPPEYAQWPFMLDYDDDEFRAGYPFSDVPEMEVNGYESWESSESPPTFDNHVDQFNNSNGYILAGQEQVQITNLSSEQQFESSAMVEHAENEHTNSNQLNNNIEEESDDDHQYISADNGGESYIKRA